MFWPSFQKGSVLKQHMLEALRDYPYTVLEVAYAQYGDGILSGFEVAAVDDDRFQISPGILKADGAIYISSGFLTIGQESEAHYVYLKMRKNANPDGTDMEFRCEQSIVPDDHGLELFRYTKNAKMFAFKNISELFHTPMNRINQIFCKYAAIGGSTLHPCYYRLFAEAVLGCANAGASDVAFAYQCLNGIRTMEVVERYFKGASENLDVLREMKNILDKLGKEGGVRESQPERPEPPRKMLIS